MADIDFTGTTDPDPSPTRPQNPYRVTDPPVTPDASPWANQPVPPGYHVDPITHATVYSGAGPLQTITRSQPIATPTAATPAAGGGLDWTRLFANIPGFEFDKLTDPTRIGTGKYDEGVRWLSQALAATGLPASQARGQGQVLADWINSHGGRATVSGDRISINGGPPVDFVRDTGSGGDQYWYQNIPGGGGSAAPTAAAPSAPTSRAAFVPLDAGLSGSYSDAVQVIRDRYRQYYGTEMSEAQLGALKQQYGFTADTAGTSGTAGTRARANRLDPGMTGTADQAVAYLQGEAQRLLGRSLTDAEIQQAAASVGYTGSQVTGAMVNSILGGIEAQAPMTGGSAGTAGSSRTYTAADINPILQQLYSGVSGGGPSGPMGPGPGGRNPGGYTDESSKLFLDQVLQRLMELRTPTRDPMEDFLKLQGLQRFQSLQGAPYTAGDDAAMVTHYRDPMTQARDSAKAQAAEELSRRGVTPGSGLFQRRMGEIDRTYQTNVAQGATALGVKAVDEKQRRADQSLSVLMNLLNVNRSGADRQNARYDQALNVAKMLPDFDQSRLDALLRASGEGPNSVGMMSNLTQLANLGFTQNRANAQDSQANSAAWGQMIGALLEGLFP